MRVKTLLISSSALLGLAVMLGAFGAHGIEGKFAEKYVKTFKTGVTYHYYHAFGIFLLGLAKQVLPNLEVKFPAWFFLMGIVLFSGNCYLYTLSMNKTFAMIVPLGGVSFIAGWVALATALLKTPEQKLN